MFKNIVVSTIFAVAMFAPQGDAAKSIRNHIVDRMEAKIQAASDYYWIGTAPSCQGSCDDCTKDGKGCFVIAKNENYVPWEFEKYKSSFGSDCWTGSKVLCGPKERAPGNYWVGTSPSCEATCNDCTKDGKGCLVVAKNDDQVPNKYNRYKSLFGKDCWTGNKVLCGPKEEATGNYWIGTSPSCEATCDDCTKDDKGCFMVAKTSSEIGYEFVFDRYTFGRDCATGNKVLCGPKEQASGHYWVGTSPSCEAKCGDCTKDNKACLAIARYQEEIPNKFSNYKKLFGRDCWTGGKALCGPKEEATGNYWIGTALYCEATCNDCTKDGKGCLVVAQLAQQVPSEYVDDKYTFGRGCTGSGNKALCGPKEKATGNYWIGTAPYCRGSCDSCAKDGKTCLIEVSNIDDIPERYLKDSFTFGVPCSSGKKVLCIG